MNTTPRNSAFDRAYRSTGVKQCPIVQEDGSSEREGELCKVRSLARTNTKATTVVSSGQAWQCVQDHQQEKPFGGLVCFLQESFGQRERPFGEGSPSFQ